jgi:hypothetical protein
LDNVVMDLVVMGFRGWTGRVKDRVGWRRVAKETKAQELLLLLLLLLTTTTTTTCIEGCFEQNFEHSA